MRIADDGKSWLIGLLCGALLAGIHLYLFSTLGSRDSLMALVVPAVAYVIVSAASTWIVSLWAQSSDAGLKAGCITGLFGGIGAFCVLLTFLLIFTSGQLAAGRGYALAALLAFLPSCLLGIGLSLGGTLLGQKMAHVEW